MSAPAPGPRASFSATGYADGLGRRTLVFDRETGAAAERLTLRAEFGAFERVLRDRAVQLAAWEGDGLARPTRVHREQPRGPLCVDADLPAGDRLIDVLDAAIEGRSDQPLAGIDIALGFLLDVLPTLDRLHRRGRVVHGAIAPGRLLLSPSGRIVLLDALYGDALERMAWPPARLWRELGVSGPIVTADAAPGRVGDLSQVGLTTLMLLLGRPLGEADWPDGLSGALAEALEIGELHGGAPFASGLDALLERLLPRATAPFTSALEAQQQARGLAASAMGIDACEQALRGAAEAMANLPMPELPELRAIAEAPLPPPPQAAASPPAAPEPAVLDLRIDIPADIPVPRAAAHEEPTVQPVATPADAAPEPTPVPDTMAPAVSEPAPEAIPEMIPPEPVAGPPETDLVAAAAEPLVAPEAPAATPKAESPRRQKRERRRKDGLRSSRPDAPAPPAAPPPVPAEPPPPAPVARPPVTALRPAPRPTFPQPVFAEPGAYGAGSTVPASPYLSATDAGRAEIPVVPAPLAPVPLQPPAAAIAVKGAPIVVKNAPRPKRERMAPSPYDAPPPTFPAPPPTQRSGGTRWKIAAAAIVVLLVGIAAGRDYLPDRTQAAVPAGRTVTPASANVAPAAPATGTLVLSSTPAGARVLVDGTAAGETPLTLEGVRPGRRTITFVASGGSVTRTVRIVAGETATLDVPVFSGWLAVDAPIVLEVAQNERVIGTTQSRLLMPPGRHTVTLTNADLGYRATQVVDITPGEERRLTLVPATEVNLNASPWAEVWIDGKRVGETPIARVSIPLGTREIVFRHPQYGERRLTPTIRVGAPEAISVDFTQPVAR